MDLTSYYAQFYRIGGDSDGRLSPFSSGGANTKYNGNITLHPAPTCQSTQEVYIDFIATIQINFWTIHIICYVSNLENPYLALPLLHTVFLHASCIVKLDFISNCVSILCIFGSIVWLCRISYKECYFLKGYYV